MYFVVHSDNGVSIFRSTPNGIDKTDNDVYRFDAYSDAVFKAKVLCIQMGLDRFYDFVEKKVVRLLQ